MHDSLCVCSTPGLGSIELPDTMSSLTALRRLILSGWCYSTLPGVVGRLSQIQELDFRWTATSRCLVNNGLICTACLVAPLASAFQAPTCIHMPLTVITGHSCSSARLTRGGCVWGYQLACVCSCCRHHRPCGYLAFDTKRIVCSASLHS